MILDRLPISRAAGQGKSCDPERSFADGESGFLTAEDKSMAELEKLQERIEERKRIAANMDIAYHLWGFYRSHFRHAGPHSVEPYIRGGEWYDVKLIQASTGNGLHQFEFELKGARYKFVDDEERQGWRENLKFFSLFLYDDADRCLIEIPMKMRVDKLGRNYSIASGGPNAFLPGAWINEFVNVTLKHQQIRNQEIRAQEHQERLCEIQDLKKRFGLSD